MKIKYSIVFSVVAYYAYQFVMAMQSLSNVMTRAQ